MDWQIIMAVAGVGCTVSGALATALFGVLVKTLEKVVDRLDRIAENTAAHGARLDALERGL